MKVILEAFGGRLRSEVMDWPDEGEPPYISMMLDIDPIPIDSNYSDISKMVTVKMGRFIHTQRYLPLPPVMFNGRESSRSAVIYRLVGI